MPEHFTERCKRFGYALFLLDEHELANTPAIINKLNAKIIRVFFMIIMFLLANINIITLLEVEKLLFNIK